MRRETNVLGGSGLHFDEARGFALARLMGGDGAAASIQAIERITYGIEFGQTRFDHFAIELPDPVEQGSSGCVGRMTRKRGSLQREKGFFTARVGASEGLPSRLPFALCGAAFGVLGGVHVHPGKDREDSGEGLGGLEELTRLLGKHRPGH